MNEEEKAIVIEELISFYNVFQEEVLDIFPRNITKVTPLQFRALQEIYFNNDITSSVLTKRLSITVPNTSRCLNQLSEMNYITRVKDEKDRRITHTKLTDEGIKLIEKSVSSMNALMLKRLGVLQLDELIRLSDAFATIKELFEKMGTLSE